MLGVGAAGQSELCSPCRYSREQLFEVVDDVAAYEEFVPWCEHLHDSLRPRRDWAAASGANRPVRVRMCVRARVCARAGVKGRASQSIASVAPTSVSFPRDVAAASLATCMAVRRPELARRSEYGARLTCRLWMWSVRSPRSGGCCSRLANAALVRRAEMAVGFKWFQEKYISQVRSVRPLRSECNAELTIAERPKPMRAITRLPLRDRYSNVRTSHCVRMSCLFVSLCLLVRARARFLASARTRRQSRLARFRFHGVRYGLRACHARSQ